MYFNFVIITTLLCTFLAENSALDCYPCICERKENTRLLSVSCLDRFSTIPDSIKNFQDPSQINELDFTGNAFEELNDDVSYLNNTKKIIFSNNLIRTIRIDYFKNLTNLETLKLDGNQLSDIQPGLFKYNRKIKYIFLESNKIKYLRKKLFNNLPDLMEVHLNNNQIEIIEDYCFAGVPSLGTLDLHDNKLQTLSTTFIDNPESLILVHLGKNPWRCDSELCDIINKSLRKNWLQSIIKPECFDSSNKPIRNWYDVQVLESVKFQKIDTNEIICQVETCAEKQIIYLKYKEQFLENVNYCMHSHTHTITHTFFEFGKNDEGLYTCLIKDCSYCKYESRNLTQTNNEKITTTNEITTTDEVTTEDITTTELSVTDETTETTETTTITETTTTTETPKFEFPCLDCILCMIIAFFAGLVIGLICCLPLMILFKSLKCTKKLLTWAIKNIKPGAQRTEKKDDASTSNKDTEMEPINKTETTSLTRPADN